MNLPFWLDTSTKLFRWNAYTLFFIFFTLLNNLQLYIICRYNNCPIHETLADITFTDYLFILSGHQLQTWYCQFCQVYYTKIMFLKIHPVFTLLTHTFKVYHYGLHFELIYETTCKQLNKYSSCKFNVYLTPSPST